MTIRRTIHSTIGHRIVVELKPGGESMTLEREDLRDRQAIVLGAQAARILSAYLSSALVIDRKDCDPERIGDIVIAMIDDPAPIVRVRQGANAMDIHAPSWEALHCEIDLVTPRLKVTERD